MATHCGKVYLVGAGPGDPGLLTLHAKGLIEFADVVVYDNLANDQLLDWARADCKIIYVGKKPGRHAVEQDKIENILVKYAGKGLQVVRLKGGDPFVFGRGGEEAHRLDEAGIPFTIVPGITAALAAAAYGGIPLTHRDHSSAISFITGHENPDKKVFRIDFKRFANTGGTLCIYMGMGQLPRIVGKLRKAGQPPGTAVAVVQWATLNKQRSVFGDLGNIEEKVAAAGISSPAVIIAGDIVRLRKKISWFEKRPLFGRRLLIDSGDERSQDLSRQLEHAGADVIHLPITVSNPVGTPELLRQTFTASQTFPWIVFSSPKTARGFFDLFFETFGDIRLLGTAQLAAADPATAAVLAAQRLPVDRSLDQQPLGAGDLGQDTSLLVVDSGGEVPGLAAIDRGRITSLSLFQSIPGDLDSQPDAVEFVEQGADAILLAQPSSATALLSQWAELEPGKDARQPLLASAGAETSKILRSGGLQPAFETDLACTLAEATLQFFNEKDGL